MTPIHCSEVPMHLLEYKDNRHDMPNVEEVMAYNNNSINELDKENAEDGADRIWNFKRHYSIDHRARTVVVLYIMMSTPKDSNFELAGPQLTTVLLLEKQSHTPKVINYLLVLSTVN
jgi:hypothetical protein